MLEAIIYAAAAALFVVLLFLPGRSRDSAVDAFDQIDIDLD